VSAGRIANARKLAKQIAIRISSSFGG